MRYNKNEKFDNLIKTQPILNAMKSSGKSLNIGFSKPNDDKCKKICVYEDHMLNHGSLVQSPFELCSEFVFHKEKYTNARSHYQVVTEVE